MRIQFLIQLIMALTIHHLQGLIIDCLAFDSSGMTKYGLTYTTLLKVHSKEHLYLFSPILYIFFKVDNLFQEKMFQLRTNTQYKLSIYLKSYCLNFCHKVG